MNRTYKISEMSWTEFDKRRNETELVIIPTGAVEIYGPHLPMGSDGIVAEHIANKIAEKHNGLIAPFLPLSDSSSLLDFPGTFSITRQMFTCWIKEMMENLIGYGFKRFLFITGHAGSVEMINSVAREQQLKKGIQYAQIDWWRFAATHSQGIMQENGYMAHGHASECGTSVMLYIAPSLVNMDEATCEEPDKELYNFMDIQRYIPISKKSSNSIVGNATIASADKGKQVIEACLNRISEFIIKEWK